jgi:hypothetical protein
MVAAKNEGRHNMEQVIVTVYSGGVAVHQLVPAWLQVDTPMSWSGHLIAEEGHRDFRPSEMGPHRFSFSLKTMDGRSGQIFIISANPRTREVYFEGSGPFSLLQ